MILAIENFFADIPRIAYLNVPAETGGVDNFVKRIVNAKRPPEGFTGPSGFTAGIVFVYGAISSVDIPESEIKAIKKAFDIITKVLS